MAGTTNTISAASDTESDLTTVRITVAAHDTLIKYLLVGIVGSISFWHLIYTKIDL